MKIQELSNKDKRKNRLYVSEMAKKDRKNTFSLIYKHKNSDIYMKTLWFNIHEKDREAQAEILSKAIETNIFISKKLISFRERSIKDEEIKDDIWDLVSKIRQMKPEEFCHFRLITDTRFQEGVLNYEITARCLDEKHREIVLTVVFPRETAFKLIQRFNLRAFNL